VRLQRLLNASPVPIVLVDGERRYVEANTPARLAFRLSRAELRELRIDDLTAPDGLAALEQAWERLIDVGCTAGPYEVALLDGGRLEISYYALANALPGVHAIAFAPAGWPDCELVAGGELAPAEPLPRLTPRELEVLELAAEGCSGPMIARELVVSVATVRTHFEHIYEKLNVRDRAGAVARAMRLGLIV
jgi:DNA-binding CsgD family transcriptional regulator